MPPQQGLSTSPQVSLSDSLGGFAESIASAARLTFKQEISHQQQAAYERERERQHKYKATFITLVEDIETKIEDVSKSNANLDKQVDHHAKAQTDVTKKLESALEAMRVNTSPLENTHDSKSAKNGSDSSSKDFEKLQTDLRAARDDIAYLKRKAVMESDLDVHFSRLVPREELRRFVTADELSAAENRAAKKQEDHSAKLAALTPIVNHTSQRISELSGIIDKRQNLAEEKLQLQGKRISNLDNGMDAADTKIAGWEKMVETQNHERSALKKDIEDYRSTVANLVAFVEGDVLKLTNLANDNFNDIRKIQASVNELCEHIQLAKTEQNPLRCIPSTPSTFKTEAEITEKLGLLQVDLDSLKEAEEKRDESVTTELAQLDSLLNRHAADLSRLQNDVQTMKQNTQQNQSVHPFHTTHPHSPPPSSTFSSPREPNHQKLQDLEMDIRNLHDRTASLQVFMDSQQQKYDQFTTDRVVHSMIHQMQQLYPQHPGNTLAQINQMGRKLAGVEAFLTSNLNSCLGAIDARFANMDIAIAARVGADSIQNLDKKMQEILKTGNEKSNMLVNVSKALSAEIAKSEQFKRTVIGVHGVQIKILSNTLGELSKKFEKLEKDTEQLTTLANDIPHLARDVSILNKELDDSPQFSRGADSAPRDLINAPLKTRKDLDEDLLTARRSSSRPESHSSDREEPLAKSNGVEPDEKAGKSPEKVTTSNSGIHGESGCNSDDQDSDDDIFPTATSRRVKYRAKIGRSPELKRRRVESSDYGDFGVPASTNSKKVPKRKNVSGRNPLA